MNSNEVDAGCVGVWKGERSKEATERAQKNLEAFITAIEANEEQWLKDKILIRFGDATHITLEHGRGKADERDGVLALFGGDRKSSLWGLCPTYTVAYNCRSDSHGKFVNQWFTKCRNVHGWVTNFSDK